MIKKILKYTGFTILGIFFALLIAPYFFKDEIVEAVKNAIHDNVNAEVTFEDIDVSLIRSFPDLLVSVQNLSVIGVDTFESTPLVKTEKLNIDLDLIEWLFGESTPSINYIGMENGLINVLVLSDNTANYNIMKEDTSAVQAKESGEFTLNIKKYTLDNVDISYADQTLPVFVSMANLNHSGKGDFTQTIFDLKTKTSVDSMTLRYDNVEYIKDAKVGLETDVNVNMDEMKFSLANSILQLNELDANVNAMIDLDESSIGIKLDVNTKEEDIRHLISIIPALYSKDFAQVKTKGTAKLNLNVDGKYDGVKNILPAFTLETAMKDGYISYPGSPFPVENLNFSLKTGAKHPQYNDLMVNIPQFRMSVQKEEIKGNLLVNNAMGNQAFSGMIAGKLNLNNLHKALQLTSFERLEGIVQANLSFKALMNDITAENYEKIDASGKMTGNNFNIKSAGQPLISIASLTSDFSPQKLSWAADQLKIDGGTYEFDGYVSNPLAAFTMEKGIQAKIKLHGDKFDMNHWATNETTTNEKPEQSAGFSDKETAFVNKSGIDVDVKINEVISGEQKYQNLVVDGSFASNKLDIKQLSVNLGKSDILLKGVVSNVFDYLFSNGTLLGELYFISNYLDANAFMGGTETESTTETQGVFEVPERMDLTLHTEISGLQYTDMTLKNVNGTFSVKNREAAISGFSTEALGGKIGMEGLYNTIDVNNPDYSLKLDLSKIKFAEAFKKLNTFRKLVPIAEYIDGFFNTTLVMKGKLDKTMSPDLSTLDASGFIETLQGKISAYPPLLKVGNTLNLPSLKNIDITDTKNWFDIVQGILDIKPWSTKLGEIPMDIQGKHSFATGMDFDIKMDIPRKLLEKNSVTAMANTGISLLEKESQKLGIPFSQGETIPVLVNLKGKLLDPKISIKPLAGNGKGSIGDAVKNQATETGKAIKDSLDKVFEKEKQRVRDSINNAVKKEADKLKTKVEQETQKVLDDAKQKAKDKVDTLLKGQVQDSLKKKAEELLNKNADKEIDKIKDKLKDFDPFKKKKDKN